VDRVVEIFKKIYLIFFLLFFFENANSQVIQKTLSYKKYNISFVNKMTCVFGKTVNEKDIIQVGLTKKGLFFYEEPFELNKKFNSISKKKFFVKKTWFGDYELKITDRKDKNSKIIIDFKNKKAKLNNEKGQFNSERCY